jgi:hypothetical protein
VSQVISPVKACQNKDKFPKIETTFLLDIFSRHIIEQWNAKELAIVGEIHGCIFWPHVLPAYGQYYFRGFFSMH